MINKKGLWFLTLFSLVLVLGVYYVTMPNQVFESDIEEVENVSEEKEEEVKVVNSENTSYVESLKVELDGERAEALDTLQEVINDSSKSKEERNKAYEEMKEINNTKATEEEIVKKIKDKYNLNSYVKKESNKIEVVIDSKKHDIELANKIMRTVQEGYDDQMTISVKFS